MILRQIALCTKVMRRHLLPSLKILDISLPTRVKKRAKNLETPCIFTYKTCLFKVTATLNKVHLYFQIARFYTSSVFKSRLPVFPILRENTQFFNI
jgi:hypothetical protein